MKSDILPDSELKSTPFISEVSNTSGVPPSAKSPPASSSPRFKPDKSREAGSKSESASLAVSVLKPDCMLESRSKLPASSIDGAEKFPMVPKSSRLELSIASKSVSPDVGISSGTNSVASAPSPKSLSDISGIEKSSGIS